MFGIQPRDGIEMYLEDESIVLAKYREACCFCGGSEGLERFRGKWVCGECLRAMSGDLTGRGVRGEDSKY
jgi:transcriptional pleiotropic regulator of transition state genes